MDEGLRVLRLYLCAHGANRMRWVVEHLVFMLHRLPLVAVAFARHRAAMMADAGMQQIQACITPSSDCVKWQICNDAPGPMLSTLIVFKQTPALRPVATWRCVPAGWALFDIVPVAALKTCVGFADVVQKGQYR